MSAPPYETVQVERRDRVVLVTLNRPDRLNALNWRLGLEMRHAIVAADADDEVRAIVVTGAGRAFCAGQDLSSGEDAFRGGDVADAAERRRIVEALSTRDTPHYWRMNTPIIAAMNGAAVGAGLTIPLQWDIRIAAEDAKLGFVFNRRGILPELNSPLLLPRIAGLARGMELLLTGRMFTGAEAAQWGVVTEAAPAAEVLPRALAIADEIARNTSPITTAMLKRLVYEGLTAADAQAAEDRNHELMYWTVRQPDAAEGPAAFMARRAPEWVSRKNSDFPQRFFEPTGARS